MWSKLSHNLSFLTKTFEIRLQNKQCSTTFSLYRIRFPQNKNCIYCAAILPVQHVLRGETTKFAVTINHRSSQITNNNLFLTLMNHL